MYQPSRHSMCPFIKLWLCTDTAGAPARAHTSGPQELTVVQVLEVGVQGQRGASTQHAGGSQQRLRGREGGREQACTPQHLDVQVHELVLLEDVVDLPGLQPGVCLLVLLLEVDEYPQATLGVVQRRLVGPGIRRGCQDKPPRPATAWEGTRLFQGHSDDHGPGVLGWRAGPTLLGLMGQPGDTGWTAPSAKTKQALGREVSAAGQGARYPASARRRLTSLGAAGNTSAGRKLTDHLGQSVSDSSEPRSHPEGCRVLFPKFLTHQVRVGPDNVHFQQLASDVGAAGPGTPLWDAMV